MDCSGRFAPLVVAFFLAGCGGEIVVTDAGTGDGGAACSNDEGCDDGVFCNGVETCGADGRCAAGPLPSDDGVDCTLDRCDEDAGEVAHELDDDACSELSSAPTCDSSGNVVQSTGVCTASGCEVENVIVEACGDAVDECTGSAGGGDLSHRTAASCVETASGAECERVTTACEPSAGPSCADGMLTTTTPECDAEAGCGETTATAACPTANARCIGPNHVTYAPACESGTACGTGTQTTTTCDAPPTACVGLVHTVYAPTCDAETGCGYTATTETSCARASECSAGTVVSYTCSCSAVAGCNCVPRPAVLICPSSSRCVDGTTLESTSGGCSADGTGCGTVGVTTTTTTCPVRCCPGTDFPRTPARCCT